MLILEDNDLKKKPVETMKTVWQFVQLAHMDVTNITDTDVHNRYCNTGLLVICCFREGVSLL